jgi:hypothetical protein
LFISAHQAEPKAVKELVDVISKGRSDENYRKYYRFWKFLHEVRVEGTTIEEGEDSTTRMIKAGMTNILLFRTGGFNRRFFQKTKGSLEAVRKWNQFYYPYMEEVQMRVLDERRNDFSGKTDLHQLAVRKALRIAVHHWVNGIRELDQEEQLLYKTDVHYASSQAERSSQSTREVLRDGIRGDSERNNAIYVCLVPYEGPPNKKRKLDGAAASRTAVAPCPVIPIAPGEFLGVLSGQLRYTQEVGNSDKAIRGPHPKLWLDFSKFTGKLS